jgi:hypothetical protein
MTAEGLVLAVTFGMTAATCVAVVMTIVHGAVHDRRHRRSALMRQRAVLALGRQASGLPVDRNDATAIEALTATDAVEVVGTLGDLVRVDDAEVLRLMAAEFSLDQRAHRLIGSRLWRRRLVGVRLASLLRLDDDAAVAGWCDRSAPVRAVSADVLGQRRDVVSIQRLVGLLGDRNGVVRFAAANGLVHIGLPVAPVLRERLESVDEATIGELEVAGAIRDPRLGPAVARHLGDPRPEARAAVVSALGRLGDRTSLELVEDAAHDPDPRVRRNAVRALGLARHWPGAGTIADRLDDADPDVVRAAGTALLDVGAPGKLFLQRGARGQGESSQLCRHLLDVDAVVGAGASR